MKKLQESGMLKRIGSDKAGKWELLGAESEKREQ